MKSVFVTCDLGSLYSFTCLASVLTEISLSTRKRKEARKNRKKGGKEGGREEEKIKKEGRSNERVKKKNKKILQSL